MEVDGKQVTCGECKFLTQGEFHCFCANKLNKNEQLRKCILSIDIYQAPDYCKVFESLPKIKRQSTETINNRTEQLLNDNLFLNNNNIFEDNKHHIELVPVWEIHFSNEKEWQERTNTYKYIIKTLNEINT